MRQLNLKEKRQENTYEYAALNELARLYAEEREEGHSKETIFLDENLNAQYVEGLRKQAQRV